MDYQATTTQATCKSFKIKLSPEVGFCTVMPLFIFFRKHPREVDPGGEAFLPQRAYHLGRKQEGPEE